MEDGAIIELYWQRSERAIEETRTKYGGYCYQIAFNLLRSPEDAEETVSDTYHAAWNAMPPERPGSLRAWLGRVARNLSLGRWNREHRRKRGGKHDRYQFLFHFVFLLVKSSYVIPRLKSKSFGSRFVPEGQMLSGSFPRCRLQARKGFR